MALAACSDPPEETPCDPFSLRVVLEGTFTHLGNTIPVTLEFPYSDGIIPGDSYAYLVSILARGESTGSSSAVFQVVGSPLAASLTFQLGGTRAPGVSLPVLGVLPQGLPHGRGPPLSAVPISGFFVLFSTDDYRATTAAGGLSVTSAAPLRGNLALQFEDAEGVPATLQGAISAQPSGPGCE